MARLKIIAIVVVFLVATCAAVEGEDGGIKEKLKAAGETTKKAEVDIGHIIGIAAFTPIVLSSCLVWRIIAAPLYALKDTYDAITTVYKNLKEDPDEGQEV